MHLGPDTWNIRQGPPAHGSGLLKKAGSDQVGAGGRADKPDKCRGNDLLRGPGQALLTANLPIVGGLPNRAPKAAGKRGTRQMPNIPRVGDLEIKQDLDYQRREWICQRVGWVVMALVVFAALAGLLGTGPLSKTSATSSDGSLRVEFNRFLHYHNPDMLKVYLAGGVARNGELRVWLDRSYLDAIEIEKTSPEPVRVEIGEDRHIYVFPVADPSQPTVVVFHFQADQRLTLSGRVGVADKEAAEFSQFVYP